MMGPGSIVVSALLYFTSLHFTFIYKKYLLVFSEGFALKGGGRGGGGGEGGEGGGCFGSCLMLQ